MQLSKMKPGDSGEILSIQANGVIRQRLMDLGFYPGVFVEVNRNAPFRDPIECIVSGQQVSVRRHEVQGVEVAVS
ncbi:MAG: ferrous iron transport protein A [Synergistota bacterium]|nr:ferrous iron transport protein A [Synergistota bacterium]